VWACYQVSSYIVNKEANLLQLVGKTCRVIEGGSRFCFEGGWALVLTMRFSSQDLYAAIRRLWHC
jgi:hypothetical protein